MKRNWQRSPVHGLVALSLLAAAASGPVGGAVQPRPRTGELAFVASAPELHPNLARGLEHGTKFDDAGLSSVNLFNGNLLVAVSLGQAFPVDARLRHQLVLHYNSNVWDFQTAAGSATARPVRLANAGLGFDLSFGRLLAPGSDGNGSTHWLYNGPDGSPHLFYSDLHHDTPDSGDTGDATQYSRDGSYLRLRHVGAAEKRVESPDGTWKVFSPAAGAWRLSRIASPSGLGVDVTYPVDGSWTLTDSHGRVQTVSFMADPSGQYPRLVSRVEVGAAGGARAAYVFTYTTAAVSRSCADSRGGTETVPLLASITDPAGQVQTFEYATTDCVNGGRLRRLKLLEGGFLEWAYGEYQFPPFACDGGTPAYFRVVPGVTSRKMVNPDGSVAGTWTYAVQTDAAAAPSCGLAGRRTVVITPLGDKTVHHFAMGTDAPGSGSPGLYALPFAPGQPDASGQLFLAEQIFHCPSGGDCDLVRTKWAQWQQDRSCAAVSGDCFDTNRRLSRTRVVYEDDEPLAGVPRFRDMVWSNYDGLGHYRTETQTSNFGQADSLVTTRSTNPDAGIYTPAGLGRGTVFSVPALGAPWFLDDSAYVERTDEDGARTRTDQCFAADGRLLRSRQRVTAALRSTHDVVTTHAWSGGQEVETSLYGGDLQPLGLDADLCLLPLPTGRFAIQREYQHGVLARQLHLDESGAPLPFYTVDRDIDLDTGKPVAERDVSGLATAYEYDLLGRTVWEKPEEGAWTQSVYSPPNGGSAWNSGPGSILYRRPNGGGTPLQTTTMLQDVFGRRTGEWFSMPGGVISGRRTQYNALGWKTAESTAYQPGNPGTLVWTTYLDFDAFGRARTVRPPEGAAHDTVVSYLGDREVRRLRKAGKAYVPSTTTCVEDTLTAITRYDGLGRVWVERQEQPQPLQGRTAEVELVYDLSGMPSLRIQRDTVGATQETRRAEYTYDGRGFALTSTTRTASGRIASSFVYSDYDARGLFHHQEISGDLYPTAVETSHSYDAAGHPLVVADAANPSKLWKEFFYGEENGSDPSPDHRLGRLVRAVRHNYFESAHHTVTDSYVYAGLGGRVSEKTTDVHTVSSSSMELRMDKSYRLSTVWDQLGNVSQVGYPVCVSCSAGEPTAALQLTYGSSQGFVTSITGTRGSAAESWLSDVDWHLAGNAAEVTHANGVRDVYAADLYRQARPSSVTVYGPSADVRFASGPIVYDGIGRQCGIGPRGLVFSPPALAEDEDTPTACTYVHEIDPFAQWNGRVTDSSCRGNFLESYSLYDAVDRRVAFLDRKGLKKITVNGAPFWVPDADQFVRTWFVYGLTGQLLTKVDDNFSLGWRSSLDYVHGLGAVQGKANRTAAAPGFVTIYHQHPLEVRSTRPNGWAWPSEP